MGTARDATISRINVLLVSKEKSSTPSALLLTTVKKSVKKVSSPIQRRDAQIAPTSAKPAPMPKLAILVLPATT